MIYARSSQVGSSPIGIIITTCCTALVGYPLLLQWRKRFHKGRQEEQVSQNNQVVSPTVTVESSQPTRYAVFSSLWGVMLDVFDDVEGAIRLRSRLDGGYCIMGLPKIWSEAFIVLSSGKILGIYPTFEEASEACMRNASLASNPYVYHYQVTCRSSTEP